MAQPAVELFYVVPVGTVLAWYPPTNATIPPNFAYCDGSTVTDQDSPFYNTTTPDLRNLFPLGSGYGISPGQTGGDMAFNVAGWNSGSSISTGPTQVNGEDDQQNYIVYKGSPDPKKPYRFSVSSSSDPENDGNHHHNVNPINVPSPGWVAVNYIMRIK
jgi:hypothetical protein